MAQQDKAVVDWAARLRASLAPRESELAPVAETAAAEPAREAAATGSAEETAVVDRPAALESAASDLGPLAALLSVAPTAPATPPPSPLMPEQPAPKADAASAAPAGGLLSFLATAAPARPEAPPAWASPLLAALGAPDAGPAAAPTDQPPQPTAQPDAAVAPPMQTTSVQTDPAEASRPVQQAGTAAPAATPQAILSGQPVLKPTSAVSKPVPPKPPAPMPAAAQPPAATQPPAPKPPAPMPAAAPPPAATQPPAPKLPAPMPAAAQTAEAAPDPLGAPQVAAAYRAVCGGDRPGDAADEGAEWIGLARSLEQAEGGWRALFLGVLEPELPLAAALACGRRGLVPVLHATESNPGQFGRLLAALQAEGLDGGETRLLQAAVGADPEKLPPRGALVQDLLEREEVWDYLRVGVPRLLPGLMARAVPTLSARVRWLMLAPLNRMEEGASVKMLSGTWRLVAERPAVLNLANPRLAERPGIQLWRSPLA